MRKKLEQFISASFAFRDKHKKLICYLIYLFLFLVGFNPLSLGKYFAIPLSLLVVFQFSKSKLHKPSLSLILVLAFSISYALFYSIFYGFDFAIIKHLLMPIVFYLLGSAEESKTVFDFIISYFCGLMLAAFLNLSRTVADTGFDFNTDQRIYLNVFTGKSIAATLFSPFSDLAFAIAIVVIFYNDKVSQKSWIIYSISILGLLISIYGFLLLKNRSFLVCTFLIALIFLFFVFENKVVPLILIIVTMLMLIIVSLNVFGVAEALYKIPFLSRFINGGSNSNRINIYVAFFENFWKYPFGGMSGSESFKHDYVHNVFLDIYSMAGLVPFVVFGCITFFTIKYIVKMFRCKLLLHDILFIIIYFAIITLFLFEPVLQADYYYFSLTFFFFSYFHNQHKKRKCLFIREVRWKTVNV